MECLEGHKNVRVFSNESLGYNLCIECWYNHGWVTTVDTKNVQCNNPKTGWYCTRGYHTGPCAAKPSWCSRILKMISGKFW